MEDINELSYDDYLLTLLTNKEIHKEFYQQLKLDLYLTLLSLNNSNYQEKIYIEELKIISDFLRKVNNLKVKIQLKRKEHEINELLDEIKTIYENNKSIILKYNEDKTGIIDILDSRDSKKLTNLIDKMTKIKINKEYNQDYYNTMIKQVIDNISSNKYYLNDGILTINDELILPINDFYDIFDYLLNISNYHDAYINEDINDSHKNIISNIITFINGDSKLTNEIVIPVILNYLSYLDNTNYENINMSKFSIENIKISDLYSFANTTNDSNNTAKWKRISIPNDYLYQKLRNIITKGMYYFNNDKFILEDSDFKVSINMNDLITFINNDLELLNNDKERTKHL